LSHSDSPFLLVWYFWDRTLGTLCLGWLGTTIILLSASWEAMLQARVTDVQLSGSFLKMSYDENLKHVVLCYIAIHWLLLHFGWIFIHAKFCNIMH
jgi:hypothetical protein